LTAAILTVLLGALTAHSERGALFAIVVGGIVTVLLSAKPTIHGLVDQIDEHERRASLKFILVVFVVLPILPDRELDVLYGLNPRFVWLMVGFVTGLSFVSYVLGRVVGAERGIALTGILGGFVSSTATTVSMAERTREAPDLYEISSFSIIVASIVMFPRALLEIAVVNPSLLPRVVVPLGAMTGIGILIAGVVCTAIDQRAGGRNGSQEPVSTPTGAVFRRGLRDRPSGLAVRQLLVRRFGDLRDGVPLGAR